MSPRVLGFTLLAGDSSASGAGNPPPVTLVHPTLGLRLPVAGGGPEAWEPLRPPASECPPAPSRPMPAPGAWNPNLHPAEAAVPGDEGWSLIRAPPLGPAGTAGKASRPTGTGWVECSECSGVSGRVYFIGDTVIYTSCAQHDIYILHPAGFVYAGSDVPAHGAAVVVDCPRGPYFAASPWGVLVRAEHGAVEVRAERLGVVGRGGPLDAARALASLVLEPEPPWAAMPGLAVRCSGRPCRAWLAGVDTIEISLWNPVKEPVVVEVVPKFRPGRAVVIDPIGEVEVPVERGLVRISLPGYTWAQLIIEKRRSLADEVRRRLASRRG